VSEFLGDPQGQRKDGTFPHRRRTPRAKVRGWAEAAAGGQAYAEGLRQERAGDRRLRAVRRRTAWGKHDPGGVGLRAKRRGRGWAWHSLIGSS